MKITHKMFTYLIVGTVLVAAACSDPQEAVATGTPNISDNITYRESVQLPASNQLHIYRDEKEDTTCYVVIRWDYRAGSAISCIRENARGQ